MKRQAGISLSELLISLLLSSLLFTILFKVYLSIKSQYVKNQKLLEFNSDVQWVSDLLSQSIRHAGFSPCRRIDHLQTVDSRDSSVFSDIVQIKNGPDHVLKIYRMSNVFSTMQVIQGSRQILLSGPTDININHPIIVADCFHAEIHRVAVVQKQAGNYLITLSEPLLFEYPSVAYIGRWLEEKWYIKSDHAGHHALNYKLMRSEELSALIQVFHATEKTVNNRLLINVSLGTEKDDLNSFTVAVRNT